ncbi:MAG: flagellar filament capping protein FliD [Gammaproteobacteria bacterium]
MISALGIGSGIDANSIVEQLMSLERAPLNNLEQDKSELNAQLSTFGQLKSALSSFQKSMAELKTTEVFKRFSAASSDEGAFTVNAGPNASIGSTDIQINNLAEVHKMGSLAFADVDTTLIGTAGEQITYTINGESFVVDAGGKTLEQMRDAINHATDNTGVTATIINESDTSHYLVFTSTESGLENSLGVTYTGGLSATLGMSDLQLAEDAEVLIDGTYTISRPSNVISDAVDGLTLSLLAETTEAAELTVTRNIEGVTESVNSFVEAYNSLNKTLDGFSNDDFGNDGTLRRIDASIRGVLNTAPEGLSGSFTHLTNVGVSILRDGTMTLDQSDLEASVQTDFNNFSELFADDDQGYLFRLDALVDTFLDVDGLLDNRTSSIGTRIRSVDRNIESTEYRLGLTELRLRNQFETLDTLIGQLNGTSQYLTSQLAALPGFTFNQS